MSTERESPIVLPQTMVQRGHRTGKKVLLFGGESVSAIRPGFDAREAMISFEEIVALFEITPESDQRRLSGVRCYQGFQAVVRESHRENLNWQVLVILVVDQDGKPINLFDPFTVMGMQPIEAQLP